MTTAYPGQQPMTPPVVYTDSGPPLTLSWPIVQGVSGLDLTTVTGAVFTVTSPAGTTLTWTGTVQAGATTTACTLLYAFKAGDVATAGLYIVRASVVVPGGSVGVYRYCPVPAGPQVLRAITPSTLR